MSDTIKVLDHGYVALIDVWGSDERIIEAARQSTQGGFVSWEPYEGHPRGDAGLLAYLWKNNHSTPFEFGGLVIQVQAPIFVFREWHRHRTQSYNEMSARYAPLPDLNYVPTIERLMVGGGHLTKQAASTGATLTEAGAKMFIHQLRTDYAAAEATYQNALADGVPKELARLVLPVGRYSRMRASANLRNWLGFLTLRTSPNAQLEIREYANAVSTLVQRAFPRTHALWSAGDAA